MSNNRLKNIIRHDYYTSLVMKLYLVFYFLSYQSLFLRLHSQPALTNLQQLHELFSALHLVGNSLRRVDS